MINRLAQFIYENAFDPIQATNDLQGAGIVSDNALMPGDVAEADWDKAIAFLREDLAPES